MSSYGGSRYGSKDNLDDDGTRQPRPQPRQAPVPQSRDQGYNRAYVRNEPAASTQGRGAPPSYVQYAGVSRTPADRYGERPAPRSHSPGRPEERPQDQYFPSRSHSPSSHAGNVDAPGGRYDARSQPRDAYRPPRSYSPARTLDPGYTPRAQAPGSAYVPSQSGYAASQSGYAPSQSGYAPSQSGYAPSQSGYAPSQSGYAPSQSGYAASQSGYAPSNPGYSPGHGHAHHGGARPRGPSSTSGYQPVYQPGSRSTAHSQSSQPYTPRGPPTKNYYGYQKYGQAGYATRHTKPKHKTVTRDGGYYNVYTDAVVKTKKLRSKGVPTTFLVVTRPWSKNHSNQPRDFMSLVIASIFFNPLFGIITLFVSCMTKRAVTEENWAKAGLYGRITFWMSIATIITGLISFALLLGFVHNEFVPPARH